MPEIVNTSKLTLDIPSSIDDDADRPTAIKIDHVSMKFNMASEQLDNLKEYFLKLVKHQLFFEEFTALDDISFEVKKGDVYGIVGTNGSGKSTLLKIIAGVLEPTAGSVELNGSIAPLIELGAGFDTELSARENIYLNGALLGYSHDFIEEHFDAIVEFAEVEKFLDMPLKNYSSGMVSRIAFAIATVIIPEILIVDEVLSVGDFMFQKKCEDRITELIEQHGVTVLIVSHSNDQVARLCNKAVWIEKGHLRLKGDANIVTKVYGALAGRSGDPETEQRIFNALQASLRDEAAEDVKVISGDSSTGTNVNMVREAWDGCAVDTFVFASDGTHANAVLGAPLAGALDCPLLPIKPDEIPDPIMHALREKEPPRIILVDMAARSLATASELGKLPWNPEVIRLGNDGSLLENSAKIIEYGAERHLWDDSAALIDFNANSESIALMPYLYARKCPVLLFDQNQDMDQLRSLLEPFEEVIIPAALPSLPMDRLALMGKRLLIVDEGGYSDPCVSVAAFVKRSLDEGARAITIASQSSAQWPELISSGFYSAKNGAVTLLTNSDSLNSIDESIRFIESCDEPDLTFVNYKAGLDNFERTLLASARKRS